MHARPYNFYAGPAVLPQEVLEQAQSEMNNYGATGLSLMEISHRSPIYDAIHNETQLLFKELLQLPDEYHVLFLPGGASLQFSMIPMNFLTPGKVANYILSGLWAEKAIEEACKVGDVYVSFSGKANNFTKMPSLQDIQVHTQMDAYLHITSNETVNGTQLHHFPVIQDVPLIADMSSDILSRPFDISKFAVIYAGAQKNLGPAGVTIVILREEALPQHTTSLPAMLDYRTYIKHNSLYNTPPVYPIYMVNLVLKWIKHSGGLNIMEKRNEEKARLIYDAIDQSGGFYKGLAHPASRSLMNITFKIWNDELEKRFIQEASTQQLVGLEGHRSVGHIRASVYNALPYKACQALAEFMKEFQKRYS
ncbi:3-phosphoserine/phosphohydroxythreonine transaminase [Paenibacillus oralis]|uniref:Phosphoserine aminotransferase n=1 Tax=Paenibacillus oralis TaxID=2490856 RepID=A0A3P3UC55_9BACL|nr:3-phosphoserine/phosphohydroxythreonine transaminase [Paenibacillus oralis]RRJ67256.1 3-phosphoserine/phosphohydroxythreonine transaminase [Paenibacillus oralis]